MKNLSKFYMLLLAAAVVFLASCSDDDTDPTSDNGGSSYDVVLSGTYSSDVVIAAGSSVQLSGTALFTSGADLTINHGVTIESDTSSSEIHQLVIDVGSQIFAYGSNNSPVVFTSGKSAGLRTPSDWGGILILGDAPVKTGGTLTAEGITETYGGSDATDNSGVLQYVRIEFAGFNYSPTSQLNGLGLFGVGSGTTVSYVQAHNCDDDGIEMFGGEVDLDHIVSTANGDDQIDCDDGWQGTLDVAVSVSVGGDSCFEMGSSAGESRTSDVILQNITALSDSSDYVALFRGEGTYVIYNSYFAATGAGSGDAIRIDQGATDLTFEGSRFNLNSGSDVHFITNTNTSVSVTLTGFETNYDGTYEQATISAISGLSTTAILQDLTETGVTLNGVSAYIGASSGTDWAAGWTSFNAN